MNWPAGGSVGKRVIPLDRGPGRRPGAPLGLQAPQEAPGLESLPFYPLRRLDRTRVRSSGAVLGIDPGLSRCGYGAVAGRAPRSCAVAYGVIATAPTDPLPDRLAQLAPSSTRCGRAPPGALAVERVLFQVNARTAISVGQASGLALAVAARAGIPSRSTAPTR